MEYASLTKAELSQERERLQNKYNELASLELKLDMSRGKPNREQLDITEGMLSVIRSGEDCVTSNGLDCRNYGLLDGIPRAKQLF
ncbi:MAG: aminotransferase, partial [Clostridiales bacterium]|nr:aminotransferase [Clostridiales bacterium]